MVKRQRACQCNSSQQPFLSNEMSLVYAAVHHMMTDD